LRVAGNGAQPSGTHWALFPIPNKAEAMSGSNARVPADGAAAGTAIAAFRLGIAPRLVFAFLAVTALAIAANLIAEHGSSIIETTRLRTIEKVWNTQTVVARPAPRQRAAGLDAGGVLARLDETERAARARIEANSALTSADLDNDQKELQRLAALLWHPVEGATGAERSSRPPALFATYQNDIGAAVHLADQRRERIEGYRAVLDSLGTRVKGAVDQSFKIFGRVLARESLIDLSRALEDTRAEASALGTSASDDGATLAALAASESRFKSTLERSESALKRSQGEWWVADLRAGVVGLASGRDALASTVDGLAGALARLSADRDELAARARQRAATAVERPAPTPAATAPVELPPRLVTQTELPESAPIERRVIPVPPSAEDVRARHWVQWVTVAVLLSMLAMSVSTIVSIVRPVRRMIEATRRLSSGVSVQVPRGGIKELDELAAAFNAMAEQVAASRDVTRAHHQKLEERVQERTRALKHLAEHDALTQLPNRRRLFARLKDALAESVVSGGRVGIYFLDLDNFKNVNDSLGHGFGDRVLQSVAQRLQEITDSYGFAARLGGDEFTIVYPGAPDSEAVIEAGHAICRAFQQPLRVGERELNMSVSVGISIYPDHEKNADALLRAADAALFRAKALGRNRLSVYSPEFVRTALSKFSIEQGLRRAIEHGEFALVYQPQVSLRTLEATSVEALLRWRTRSGKLLGPSAFLGVAEESGLIMEISTWVLRTAVAQAAEWYHGEWPAVRVAINVSPRQLGGPEFVDELGILLAEHRLPPESIELELTENVLQTGAATIDVLRRLRTSGIAIALDDFGAGYSSLSSLELLPLSRVKLDRSLIAGIDTSAGSRAIASAIMGLCENLSLEVTAEGIERPEQLALLGRERGVHAQGFLLAHPCADEQLLAVLAALPSHMRTLLGSEEPTAEAELASTPANVVRFGPR
jgi:diguanylate cyclase (GGDEF)-like protein